jgi:hypothetical protein
MSPGENENYNYPTNVHMNSNNRRGMKFLFDVNLFVKNDINYINDYYI